MAHLKAFLQRINIFAGQSSMLAFLGTLTDEAKDLQAWSILSHSLSNSPPVAEDLQAWLMAEAHFLARRKLEIKVEKRVKAF